MAVIARPARRSVLLSLLLAAGSLAGPLAPGAAAADPSPSPAPAASLSPVEAMCESAGDLALYVGFVRSQSLSDDGLLPIVVGAVASLAEARRLAPLVADTYRPLIDEVVAGLEAVGDAARGLRDGETIGQGIADLGTSITRLGVAMDALSVQLRTRCDLSPTAEAPAASAVPAPVASASPAA